MQKLYLQPKYNVICKLCNLFTSKLLRDVISAKVNSNIVGSWQETIKDFCSKKKNKSGFHILLSAAGLFKYV